MSSGRMRPGVLNDDAGAQYDDRGVVASSPAA
jgi:hypothetical protein